MKREITEQVWNVAIAECFNQGRCPNTGLPCDNADQRLTLSGAYDSSGMVGDPESPMGEDTRRKSGAKSDEISKARRRVLSDTEACIGGCALLENQDE